jgi:hypothetical protein
MKSTRWLLWLSGIAALVIIGFTMAKVATLRPMVMALQFSYTADAFRQVLAQWQEPGIAIYRSHFTFDYAFMSCYGLFGYLLARQTTAFDGLRSRWAARAAWAMPIAAVCDGAEDLMHFLLLSSPDRITAATVGISATFTTVKWLHVLVFAAMLVVGWRYRVVAREQGKLRGTRTS